MRLRAWTPSPRRARPRCSDGRGGRAAAGHAHFPQTGRQYRPAHDPGRHGPAASIHDRPLPTTTAPRWSHGSRATRHDAPRSPCAWLGQSGTVRQRRRMRTSLDPQPSDGQPCRSQRHDCAWLEVCRDRGQVRNQKSLVPRRPRPDRRSLHPRPPRARSRRHAGRYGWRYGWRRPVRSPTSANGSRRAGTSRQAGHRHLALVHDCGRVREGGSYIIGLEVGVVLEQLLKGAAVRKCSAIGYHRRPGQSRTAALPRFHAQEASRPPCGYPYNRARRASSSAGSGFTSLAAHPVGLGVLLPWAGAQVDVHQTSATASPRRTSPSPVMLA